MASDLVKKKNSVILSFFKQKIYFLLSVDSIDATQELTFNSKITLLLPVR